MPDTLQSAADALYAGAELCDEELHLQLTQCSLRLRSNSAELVRQLRVYFGHAVTAAVEPDVDIVAIEREAPDLGVEFVDWRREPGKTGRKDSYHDLPGARLVRKVRTGMLFLQSAAVRIAAGPCLRYDNQVINFINAQYMNWLQQRGWLICHAAGLVHRGRCFGMAGFSGGGKSTLMLRLMENDAVVYLTNDRLFVRREGAATSAVGIPKLPRINPGTIVHNARLQHLIAPEERARLLALPPERLWQIEDKYDVLVDQVYGPDRISAGAPLAAFLVLNWQRGSAQPPAVGRVDLAQRRDLLGAIMKSPGPFYQYPDGSFLQDTTPLAPDPYLETLLDVPAYEVTGGVDFDALTRWCLDEMLV